MCENAKANQVGTTEKTQSSSRGFISASPVRIMCSLPAQHVISRPQREFVNPSRAWSEMVDDNEHIWGPFFSLRLMKRKKKNIFQNSSLFLKEEIKEVKNSSEVKEFYSDTDALWTNCMLHVILSCVSLLLPLKTPKRSDTLTPSLSVSVSLVNSSTCSAFTPNVSVDSLSELTDEPLCDVQTWKTEGKKKIYKEYYLCDFRPQLQWWKKKHSDY